jgi:hypothetical protein
VLFQPDCWIGDIITRDDWHTQAVIALGALPALLSLPVTTFAPITQTESLCPRMCPAFLIHLSLCCYRALLFLSLSLLLLTLFCACALLTALNVPSLAPATLVSSPILIALITHLLVRTTTGAEHAAHVFTTMVNHPV